jgi:hypothetical protein
MKNLEKKSNKAQSWLGVVASRSSLDRIINDEKTWWCLPPIASVGDTVVMYCANNASRIKQGIFGFFHVTSISNDDSAECNQFGSFPGIKLVKIFISRDSLYEISLPLSEMKKDKFLYGEQFIRRNCQGTYFELTNSSVPRIKKMIENKNN